MSIATWWPSLQPAERAWLSLHNGEPIPPDIVVRIADAGCDVTTDILWVGGDIGGGLFLSRADIDWVHDSAAPEGPQ